MDGPSVQLGSCNNDSNEVVVNIDLQPLLDAMAAQLACIEQIKDQLTQANVSLVTIAEVMGCPTP